MVEGHAGSVLGTSGVGATGLRRVGAMRWPLVGAMRLPLVGANPLPLVGAVRDRCRRSVQPGFARGAAARVVAAGTCRGRRRHRRAARSRAVCRGAPTCGARRVWRSRNSPGASLPRRLRSLCSRTRGSPPSVRLRLTDPATSQPLVDAPAAGYRVGRRVSAVRSREAPRGTPPSVFGRALGDVSRRCEGAVGRRCDASAVCRCEPTAARRCEDAVARRCGARPLSPVGAA